MFQRHHGHRRPPRLSRSWGEGPQDIAITGFDNTKEGAYSTPTITIIAPDLDTLVEDTLKIFTPHIGQSGLEQPGTGTLVPWHLVIRESTGGPSTQC